jgi:hypothetical protein
MASFNAFSEVRDEQRRECASWPDKFARLIGRFVPIIRANSLVNSHNSLYIFAALCVKGIGPPEG